MITTDCFTKDWIDCLRGLYPGTDPGLLEKTIHAFELIGILSRSDTPFVFKGGTALMLHLPDFKRLSIDIDIIGNFTLSELEQEIRGTKFFRVEEDKRGREDIPKSHFMFYYQSLFQKRDQYVLLDIVDVENPYTLLVEKTISFGFFKVDEKLSIRTPTVEGLLGDKLVAFAPNTIGIPYRRDKSMEIMKQLFDIGAMFDSAQDLEEVRLNHNRIYVSESELHGSSYSYEDVLNDTLQSCFLICQLDLKGSEENEKTVELRKGIQQLRSHLLNTRFTLAEAKIAAAKAAFLITAIQQSTFALNPFEMRYTERDIERIKHAVLRGKNAILNRLKASLPEAFYYWYLISQ